jgi:hypothetical protein
MPSPNYLILGMVLGLLALPRVAWSHRTVARLLARMRSERVSVRPEASDGLATARVIDGRSSGVSAPRQCLPGARDDRLRMSWRPAARPPNRET